MPASDMPGRSGVTAPITPDSRTTGTTAVPGRKRAGRYCMSLSAQPELRESFNCSAMPLPLVNQFLSRECHWKCLERVLQIPRWEAAMKQRRKRHEDLPADAADRCAFHGDSHLFPAGTAVGIAS